MLATTGSAELQEWIVELGVLRPEDERLAMEKAEAESKGETHSTLGGPRPLTRAEIYGE